VREWEMEEEEEEGRNDNHQKFMNIKEMRWEI
jgi:hypothetical protein